MSSRTMLPAHELREKFTALWWANDNGLPPLGPTYTVREQMAAETHLERFLEVLAVELDRAPRTSSERRAARARLASAFGPVAQSALDLDERQLDELEAEPLGEALADFAHRARRFDPALDGEDIYQASRNLWVMNCLQQWLGLPVQVTPAAFAYSLLYPYSDNYLDDAGIPAEAKAAFNDRFRRRLAGENPAPDNSREQIIFDLVSMIEGQFARTHYPQVFESLLAIHAAQGRSLSLQRRVELAEDIDVVGISVEKGGASVLADGFLVAGSLTPAQQEFIFGYGVLAQLMDDLEDVHPDRRAGRLSVFSQLAGHSPLDDVTNRAFHFGARVLEPIDHFASTNAMPLQGIVQRGAVLLLITLAAQADQFYTRRYLQELQAYLPFRFSFLSECRRKLTGRLLSPQRLIDALALSG